MKIGELAKAANVSKDTVRHYVELGLLNGDRDPNNGYQRFSPSTLQRLRFVKTARRLGFSLGDIRAIFEDAHDERSPCPRVREMLIARIAETRRRIAELTSLCETMEGAIGVWREMPDGTPDGHSICRLIESLHEEDPRSAATPL